MVPVPLLTQANLQIRISQKPPQRLLNHSVAAVDLRKLSTITVIQQPVCLPFKLLSYSPTSSLVLLDRDYKSCG